MPVPGPLENENPPNLWLDEVYSLSAATISTCFFVPHFPLYGSTALLYISEPKAAISFLSMEALSDDSALLSRLDGVDAKAADWIEPLLQVDLEAP